MNANTYQKDMEAMQRIILRGKVSDHIKEVLRWKVKGFQENENWSISHIYNLMKKSKKMEETKTNGKSYAEKIEELKELIRASLDLCDKYKTPAICLMKADGEGYAKLEESIIDRVVKNGATISEAILQIEKENNPNIIQD